MNRIVIASNNAGKLREIRDILQPLGFTVVSQREAGISIEVEENGETFAENAALKAALQEQEERSKGCEFCNTIYDDWDEEDLAPREFRIEGNKLWYRDTKFHAWVSKTIMLCPMCGRRLKGKQDD